MKYVVCTKLTPLCKMFVLPEATLPQTPFRLITLSVRTDHNFRKILSFLRQKRLDVCI